MLRAEAVAIGDLLQRAGPLSPILNIGSSTARFRTVDQPWIDECVFVPLRERGVEVDHLDVRAASGVDIVGDILDPTLQEELAARHYRCLILANVLEHVRDRQAVAAACQAIAGERGLILVTVPKSYPYHADPRDTGYRPTPEEIVALFPGSRLRETRTIVGPTYAETLRADRISPLREVGRTFAGLLIAPVRPRSARSRLHRWLWYRRPYKVSLALFEGR